MSETITRTISEQFSHDDVQQAVLKLVRERNPTYTPKPDDVVKFTRPSWPGSIPAAPQLPGMPPQVSPLALSVDVKVTQDVPPVHQMTMRVPKDSDFARQLFGRALRPYQRSFLSDTGRLTEGFGVTGPDVMAAASPHTHFEPTEKSTPFEHALRSMHALAARHRTLSYQRGDSEAAKYFHEVMVVLWRDIGTVAER